MNGSFPSAVYVSSCSGSAADSHRARICNPRYAAGTTNGHCRLCSSTARSIERPPTGVHIKGSIGTEGVRFRLGPNRASEEGNRIVTHRWIFGNRHPWAQTLQPYCLFGLFSLPIVNWKLQILLITPFLFEREIQWFWWAIDPAAQIRLPAAVVDFQRCHLN